MSARRRGSNASPSEKLLGPRGDKTLRALEWIKAKNRKALTTFATDNSWENVDDEDVLATKFKSEHQENNEQNLSQGKVVHKREQPRIDARNEIVKLRHDPKLSFVDIPYKNGNSYYGTCSSKEGTGEPIPHGFGEKKYLGGSWYNGDWKLGRKHGVGTFFDSKRGITYTGEWRNNKRDGSGTVSKTFLCNTLVFTGRFVQNRRHGEGKLWWSTNDRVLYGIWQNGVLDQILEDNEISEIGKGCASVKGEFKAMDFKPEDFYDDG